MAQRDYGHFDRKIFPDGLKTSGQHPVDYELVRPYSAFPQRLTGPTVWESADYQHNPERWTHEFSVEEVNELSAAADAFLASGAPLTGISKDLFPLPKLSAFFAAVRNELLNGKGFILFKGLPVQEWGLHKSAVRFAKLKQS